MSPSEKCLGMNQGAALNIPFPYRNSSPLSGLVTPALNRQCDNPCRRDQVLHRNVFVHGVHLSGDSGAEDHRRCISLPNLALKTGASPVTSSKAWLTVFTMG